jgi:flagellar protein FlaG
VHAADQSSPAEIAAAVERANTALRQVTSSIEFHVDPSTKRMIVKLIDKSDGHVLRQVPSEEMLDIARALEHMQARLVQGKA